MLAPHMRVLAHLAHIAGYAILYSIGQDNRLLSYAYGLLLIGTILHTLESWWSKN